MCSSMTPDCVRQTAIEAASAASVILVSSLGQDLVQGAAWLAADDRWTSAQAQRRIQLVIFDDGSDSTVPTPAQKTAVEAVLSVGEI